MAKADEKFNQIVNEEVLPAISKAFCSLYQETKGAAGQEMLRLKANHMKHLLTGYVDGQVSCFEEVDYIMKVERRDRR